MPNISNSKFIWGGHGLSWILRSVFLCFPAMILFVFLTLSAQAESAVGNVSRVQNSAQIGAGPATVGAPVHMNDRLRTGANARLEVTFNDNSKLTLGENANVAIDRYVYNPAKSSGELALNATRGALRFAGGGIEKLQKKTVTVSTPVAAMAVRGTFGPDPLMDNMACSC